jgi:hypothetical protein
VAGEETEISRYSEDDKRAWPSHAASAEGRAGEGLLSPLRQQDARTWQTGETPPLNVDAARARQLAEMLRRDEAAQQQIREMVARDTAAEQELEELLHRDAAARQALQELEQREANGQPTRPPQDEGPAVRFCRRIVGLIGTLRQQLPATKQLEVLYFLKNGQSLHVVAIEPLGEDSVLLIGDAATVVANLATVEFVFQVTTAA